MAAAAALAMAGIVYWSTSGDGGGQNNNIAVTVVDCSQTELYEDGGPMLPARVAQIQFVNEADSAESFAAQVDGVTLQGQDGNPARYTLAPHDSKVISFPMNPTKYGNSEGACYALNVRAATAAPADVHNVTDAPSAESPAGDTSDPTTGPDATATPEDAAAEASQSAAAAASASASAALATVQQRALARIYTAGEYSVSLSQANPMNTTTIDLLADVTSHDPNTGLAKQFGIVVTLLNTDGSVNATGTVCGELLGGDSQQLEFTPQQGTVNWTAIRISTDSTSTC